MSDAFARATVTGDTRQETELDKMYAAARAMDRIEAAGRRVEMSQLDRRQFQWHVIEESMALKMIGEYGAERWKYVPWSAIRDDETDPLPAAERQAMDELKGE